MAFGSYSGYTGKKLNEYIAQSIVWHYREDREIRILEAHQKMEQQEIANLKHEIIKERYV